MTLGNGHTHMDLTDKDNEQALVEALADGLREHCAATYLAEICSTGNMAGIPHASFKRFVDDAIDEIVGRGNVPLQIRMLAEQLVLNHQAAMLLQARGVQSKNPQHCNIYIRLTTELSAENRRLLKLIESLVSAQECRIASGRQNLRKTSQNKLGSNAA